MLTRAQVFAWLDAKPSATSGRPFGPEVVVYKIGGKMFAIVADEDPTRFTLKCDPVLAEVMRGQYAATRPGYHTDKRHWITVRQDADLPDDEVTRLFDHAYDIVRAKLTRAAQAELAAAESASS
jgi:predicted DNA-binding protein (MmcQ/YjbR family)